MKVRINLVIFIMFLAVFISSTNEALTVCSTKSFSCWHDNNNDGIKQVGEIVTHYPTGNYGCAGEVFKNVNAISNGGYTETGCGEWQCVEYIKRFYYEAMGVNLYKSIGVARNYWDKYGDTGIYSYIKNSGLEKCENNFSRQLKPGDLLVFNVSSFGHVGIEIGLLNNSMNTQFIEQNYREYETLRDLPLLTQNGNHKINSATVLGWLHMPVGEFANDEYLRNGKFIAKGWHFDTDIQGQSNHYNLNSRPFTVCYQVNGGRNVFGTPNNKVHRFPDENSPYLAPPYNNMRFAWVQDFQNGVKTYTIVVNEYVLNANTWYMGIAYWLEGPIRNYFFNQYWKIGYPVTNKYSYNGYTVQWFERLDEEYYVVIYNPATNQTWHENGNSTTIPKENFNQHQELNSTPDKTGVGGGEIPDPDPIPVSSEWTLIDQAMAPAINPDTNEPIERAENFPIAAGSYAYYWAKLSSTNPEIGFEWKWYYQDPEDSENWIQISSPIEQVYVHYNPSEQEYIVWFRLDMMKCQTVGLRKAELIGVEGSVKVVGNLYFNAEVATPQDTCPRAPILRIVE